MGVYADDVREFVGSDNSGDESEKPLGERLRGAASDLSVDSVAEVRNLRERS